VLCFEAPTRYLLIFYIVIIHNGDEPVKDYINHLLIGRRRHSSIRYVRSFREADCDTDHFLVFPKVRERLAISKQETQTFDVERFNLK